MRNGRGAKRFIVLRSRISLPTAWDDNNGDGALDSTMAQFYRKATHTGTLISSRCAKDDCMRAARSRKTLTILYLSKRY